MFEGGWERTDAKHAKTTRLLNRQLQISRGRVVFLSSSRYRNKVKRNMDGAECKFEFCPRRHLSSPIPYCLMGKFVRVKWKCWEEKRFIVLPVLHVVDVTVDMFTFAFDSWLSGDSNDNSALRAYYIPTTRGLPSGEYSFRSAVLAFKIYSVTRLRFSRYRAASTAAKHL